MRTYIGTINDPVYASRYADQLFRLRYQVFHERLQWQVQTRDGRESDAYDDEHTVYVVALDDDDRVLGGWRLIPTLRPYMLADVFPQLLYGTPAPRHLQVWESNRFVVDRRESKQSRFGFNETAHALFRATAQYAVERGIREYVMVLSAGVVRLTRASGLKVEEFGPAMRIGNVMSVGCRIRIDAHTQRHLLGGEQMPLEIAA